MMLAFQILAALWVFAWVVLIVLDVVDMFFRLPPDGAYDNDPGYSVDD